MVTVYKDTEAIFDSLAAGAGGYLLKPVRAPATDRGHQGDRATAARR